MESPWYIMVFPQLHYSTCCQVKCGPKITLKEIMTFRNDTRAEAAGFTMITVVKDSVQKHFTDSLGALETHDS